MTARLGVRRIVVAATMMVMAVPCGAASSSASDGIEAANRRWRGARCRTRQPIELKKGESRDGWSKSRWLFWSPEGGNSRARLWFSDGDAVRRRFGGGLLPTGTELVARGWSVEKNDLFLELELAALPVRVKVFYWDDWVGRVSGGRIDDFERWARFDLFELLSSPAEELIEVAPAPQSPEPASPSVSRDAPRRGSGQGIAVLRVLSASVEPVRAEPGQEVQLVVVYTIDGVPPGAEIEVIESRAVLEDGRRLNTDRAVVRRPSGVHESRQSLRLPQSLAAGVYELAAEVRAGETRSEGTAIFEVR